MKRITREVKLINLSGMVPGKVVGVRTEIQKLIESYIGRGIILLCHRRERGKNECRYGWNCNFI